MMRACGVGINLHTATRVILASPHFNPMYEAQAAGRAHRIGQTKPVIVYRLAFEGAFDQKIQVLARAHMYAMFPILMYSRSLYAFRKQK